MDLESAQTNVVAKLPLLKQGDYEMWKLSIEQYFQVQDYALWDVIENVNSFKSVPQTTTNAKGASCLTNNEIFEGLARMCAKTTSWNEFSSTMASAIICLATNQKFNFSRYILLGLVKNIEVGVPFFMFPRFVQLIINHQLCDMTHHKDIFDTPSLTKKVFANMKMKHKPKKKHTREPEVPPTESQAKHNVPLPSPSHDPLPSGEDSLKLKELMDLCTNLSNKVLDLESEVIDIKSTYTAKIEKLESRVERLEEENRVLNKLKGVHSIVDSDEPVMEKEESSKQERKIADIDADVKINLEKVQAEVYNLDLDHQEKVLSMLDVNNEEPADTLITAAEATKMIVKVPKPRKRRGVIIQDPKETTTTVTVQPKVQAKDKGKVILFEEPKPLKRQVQIDLDEKVARQLEAELNADMNWNAVIEKLKRSERVTYAVMKYQALKRKPLTEAQARRNMIVYLKKMAGYKMNYFKRMSYDEIRPLFKKHYNYNQAFLNEMNEGIKVLEKEVRQEKEVEVESSKREDDDDDVHGDANSLALKIPIVDYKIHNERNKPYFQIIRAEGNHKMFISFSTMMKNFDKEDLKSLWKIIRERFKKIEPKNYTNDYLLNTLKIMFKKPNVEANV
uniref:Ribonuclease H-like domain-containing protein n=1 Tax=Tanacetum cinerariifolium TaxID=118510 RepID=A0A6L2LAX6_TANCI|nr:ribonuclease H-like domain-containing protein [Tanacetum cinerariifolium]